MENEMDMERAIPSPWFSASDFDSVGKEFTIGNVMMQQVQAQFKPVIFFQGQEKALILNGTTNKVLIGLYGKESNAWTGKKIVLYSYMGQPQFGNPAQLRLGVRAPDNQAQPEKPSPIRKRPKTVEEELDDEIPI
jgi:hypothetical protein